MKKLILTILIMFTCSGCSLIPRMTFDTKGTVPQSVDRSKVKEVCKGEAVWNEDGSIKSCSRGYVNYAEGYVKKERKMSWKEKLANIIRNTAGWLILICIGLVIFLPATAGLLVGRLIEGAVGLPAIVGKAIMRAVQKARKQGKNLDDALEAELDEKHKQYIRQIKNKESIK